jgi:transcriptional regulator with XRE-family HTH domain
MDEKDNAIANGDILLGEKVRALREERGLTLKEVSEVTKLSLTYLSEIERNSVHPSLDTVKQLAGFFGVPFGVLLTNHKSSGLPVKLLYTRKIKDLSQKELALKAGVSPGLIAQLELGKANASLKTVNKLADALGVSVCYLILDREDVDGMIASISPHLREFLQNPKVQAIIGSICTLEEPQLKLILNFIDMVKNPRLE